MLSLGVYWSYYLYADWQEKPVLTTVTTTALPVTLVNFPAVTICAEGDNKYTKCAKDCGTHTHTLFQVPVLGALTNLVSALNTNR